MYHQTCQTYIAVCVVWETVLHFNCNTYNMSFLFLSGVRVASECWNLIGMYSQSGGRHLPCLVFMSATEFFLLIILPSPFACISQMYWFGRRSSSMTSWIGHQPSGLATPRLWVGLVLLSVDVQVGVWIGVGSLQNLSTTSLCWCLIGFGL